MGPQPVWIWDGYLGAGSGQEEWMGVKDESPARKCSMDILGKHFGVSWLLQS